jgi:hypothetical protein
MVLRAPFRHVKRDAIRGLRVLRRKRMVAIAADAVVVGCRFGAARNVVRVVADEAGQAASQQTLRFAQPIGRMGDFEIVLVLSARRMIKEEHETAQRLTRLIGKGAAAVFDDRMRQRQAGDLKVALHAHLKLAVAAEARWVQDGFADILNLRARSLSHANVIRVRPVAVLVIDPSAIRRCKRFAAGLLMTLEDFRIGVVAEHALTSDGARRQLVVAVVARVHGPCAAVFGIPGEGKLNQSAAFGTG